MRASNQLILNNVLELLVEFRTGVANVFITLLQGTSGLLIAAAKGGKPMTTYRYWWTCFMQTIKFQISMGFAAHFQHSIHSHD